MTQTRLRAPSKETTGRLPLLLRNSTQHQQHSYTHLLFSLLATSQHRSRHAFQSHHNPFSHFSHEHRLGDLSSSNQRPQRTNARRVPLQMQTCFRLLGTRREKRSMSRSNLYMGGLVPMVYCRLMS